MNFDEKYPINEKKFLEHVFEIQQLCQGHILNIKFDNNKLIVTRDVTSLERFTRNKNYIFNHTIHLNKNTKENQSQKKRVDSKKMALTIHVSIKRIPYVLIERISNKENSTTALYDVKSATTPIHSTDVTASTPEIEVHTTSQFNQLQQPQNINERQKSV
ncbi:3050_t:CDS:2 [Gigaspora margarita]|uniref:3050_t:CDS:1 n=1 Tax=Gigaspora margarita TaxID=4874 RepID=A0ABN7V659_GIGMA|nr:3050_t:CDS:2 [Gigaspora margarita]